MTTNDGRKIPVPLQLSLYKATHGTIAFECNFLSQNSDKKMYQATLKAGPEGFQGALQFSLKLPALGSPWFLFPGFFYGKGRLEEALKYPALGPQSETSKWTAPSWDFALDRGSFPVLLCHLAKQWTGLEWDPHYQMEGGQSNPEVWGDSEPQIGLGFTWHGDLPESQTNALRLNIPANEGPLKHARNKYDSETQKSICLEAGQSLTFGFSIWNFAADSHGYQQVLESTYAKLSEKESIASIPPAKALAETAAHGLLAWHWIESGSYMVYTSAFDRSAEFNANLRKQTLGWHFEALGFVGGFPVAFGLQWQGNKYANQKAVEVAEKMVDRFCSEAQTEWGFFRTSYHPGKAQTPNGHFKNGAPVGTQNQDPSGDTAFYGSCWMPGQSTLHARTTADASYYLARYLKILPDSHPKKTLWIYSLRKSLQAALSIQDAQGHFGQLYDVDKKIVSKTEGAGGLLWIPALLHSEALFQDDTDFQNALLEAAKKGGMAYASDVEKEWLCGAPEDVGLSPTSEDGYNGIMAYAALFRRFGITGPWLGLLKKVADWTLTWRKAYNVQFPKRNIMGSFGFRTRGGDFASSHNNHLHVYGMCCLNDLFLLSRETGNPYYAKRAYDHFAFSSQLLCTEDGQWNGQRGMCSEQFYTSDWSIWGDWDPTVHHVQKGSLMGFSHVWTINMFLLGLQDLENTQDFMRTFE